MTVASRHYSRTLIADLQQPELNVPTVVQAGDVLTTADVVRQTWAVTRLLKRCVFHSEEGPERDAAYIALVDAQAQLTCMLADVTLAQGHFAPAAVAGPHNDQQVMLGLHQLAQVINANQAQTHALFNQLTNQMNQRFDLVNHRVDHLTDQMNQGFALMRTSMSRLQYSDAARHNRAVNEAQAGRYDFFPAWEGPNNGNVYGNFPAEYGVVNAMTGPQIRNMLAWYHQPLPSDATRLDDLKIRLRRFIDKTSN
jgi:hypothetical protein